jgi:hypothetical protein
MMRRVIIITEGKLLKTNNFFWGGGVFGVHFRPIQQKNWKYDFTNSGYYSTENW